MEGIEERQASFYLGQAYDLAAGQVLDQPLYYDARDLTTHAICLGMTGSGKTGLGAILLEEAALDGVPSLVIDPKGDMANLLLTFPDLQPGDFRPWVNPDDARRKDLDLDTYAAQVAETWRDGLLATGQTPERIARLRAAADFAIYTPGSDAGRKLSILQTLEAPSLSWDEYGETLRDKIETVVSALLGLVGIEADPVRSREHILLSNIFEQAWRAGEDLDLAKLIVRVQKPPLTQLGVFPVDVFFPEKDRLELAMLLNGLVASPAFADWTEGYPLDVGSLLWSPAGKPQVSVLYIAHLSEAERRFFVTLLLEQVVTWMRAQSGTTSLKALLYVDEMYGYLPPHPANPPTKRPMLTLLKQARAFGLGLVLTTQNPVDLDYKALSNAGTWFIGRLQADRDKQRLLDGLEGVEAGEGGPSRTQLDRMISALRSRVFILHNVHEAQPTLFRTRWALSYLRGPLTRSQVRDLAGSVALPAPLQAAASAAERTPAPTPAPVPPPSPAPASTPQSGLDLAKVPPQLPSSVKQVFVPVEVLAAEALSRAVGLRAEPQATPGLVYESALLGLARLRYPHNKSRQTHSEDVAYLLPLEGRGNVVDWSQGRVDLAADDLDRAPEAGASFVPLPAEMGEAKRYTALRQEFEDYLYYNSSITLWHNAHLDLYSEPLEGDKPFQRRCRKAAEDAYDADAAKLRAKYERELDQLEGKLRREEREMEEDKIEYQARKQEEMLSGVESVISLFAGRKSSTRLSTASRKRRLTKQAQADVEESEEVIEELEKQIDELEEQARQELEDLKVTWNERIDDLEEIEVRPRRTDVQLNLFALAWLPYWQVSAGGQTLSAPAFKTD